MGYVKWPVRRKETVWAGNRAAALFGGEDVGEVYLFSDSEAYLRRQGIVVTEGETPLVKYIDAGEAMSVQVHPRGERGKDELWIIDEVSDSAAVYIGFSRAVSAEEFLDACAAGTVLSLMRRFPVKKGDIFFIPGGTVHCAAGISFFEVQNERDVTFRLYDHGRSRELHREESLLSLNTAAVVPCSVRKTADEISELFPFRWRLCGDTGAFFDSEVLPRAYIFLSEKASFCGKGVPFGAAFFVPENESVRGEGAHLKIWWDVPCEPLVTL